MRKLVWFSCGAASAVTAKLASEKYLDLMVVYCDLSKDEHPDNQRFMQDVSRWIGKPVIIITSEKYQTTLDVFKDTRYISDPKGARCTTEMKKIPRFAFQQPDDLHLFGYTAEEGKRITKFELHNPELRLEWILRDKGLSKQDCFKMLTEAGIELPTMYRLGYRNNNCIGCVKATSANYWIKIKTDFPAVFRERAEISRLLGVRMAIVKGKRMFIDELPSDQRQYAW